MSAIHFEASLDNSKLDSAIKQSNKTIADWSKDVEKNSGKVDQGFTKMAKSFKETIKEQKDLIKSIEKDVKALQKAYDDATAGRTKQTAGDELRAAKRALAEEQSNLLGLQEKQIVINNKEAASAESLTGVIGKWALTLGGVAAGFKLLKDAAMKLTPVINLFNVGTAVTNKILENIVTGQLDWNKGVIEAIRIQREFNDLRYEEYKDSYEAQKLKTEFQRKWMESIEGELTKKEKLIKIDEALAAHEQAINIEMKDAIKLRDLSYAKLISGAGNESYYKAYWDSMKKIEALDAERFTATKRLTRQRESLEKEEREDHDKTIQKWLDEIELANKVWEERNDIGKRIAEQQKMLNDAIGDGNEKEAKDIAKKIVLLEEELKVRQKNINAALMAATPQIIPPNQGTFGHLKAPTLLPGGLKISNTLAGAPQGGDYIPGTSMLSEQGRANQKKDADEYDKDREESLNRELELRNQIVNAAADLVNQIGQMIGLDEKSMMLLNAGLNAFTSLATGDLVGAAMSLLSGILAQIPTAASKFEAQIGHINGLLEEQKRLIDLSEQKGGQELARKGELDFLKQKNVLAETEYNRLQKSADKHLDLLGWRGKKADEAYKTWQNVIDEIEDANSALDEFFTNTTAPAIADSISQGFQDGKTSAADFADTFNDFMIQAINSALTEMSKPEIAAWYKQFAIDMESGGGLSKEEIADLKIDWDKIIAEGKANRDAVAKVTELNLYGGAENATNNGLMMGIKRDITEQTGTELAGIWRRAADDIRTNKDYSLIGINHLTGIEKNTAETVIQLQLAVVELKSIVSNTKQSAIAGF